MANYVYVNTLGNYFKVWGFDCYSQENGESEVISYWGRIGLSMQHLSKKHKYFDSCISALDYVHKKIAEKLCKGYKGIPNPLYFRLIESSKGIAELLRIMEKMGEIQYYETKKTTS